MLAFGLGGPCHARNKGKVRERVGSVYVANPPSLMSRSSSLAVHPVSVATRETTLTVSTAPPRFFICLNIRTGIKNFLSLALICTTQCLGLYADVSRVLDEHLFVKDQAKLFAIADVHERRKQQWAHNIFFDPAGDEESKWGDKHFSPDNN